MGTRVARFETTDDHPWRSSDGRWLTTLELKAGVEIVEAYGAPARVVAVIKTGRTAPTFNLDVADFHTYFVGEDRIWVHNSCRSGEFTRAERRAMHRENAESHGGVERFCRKFLTGPPEFRAFGVCQD